MQSTIGANKTFGMRYPIELLGKLLFDIDRLKQAKYTREATYATFDCATGAWHLVDWCIAHARDDQIKAWTGLDRDSKKSLTLGFVKTNAHHFPRLGYCQLIANSFKHLKIDFDDENLTSHNSVRFDPPFQADVIQNITTTPVGNIIHLKSGERFEAVALFTDLAHQWHLFLKREEMDLCPDEDLETIISETLLRR